MSNVVNIADAPKSKQDKLDDFCKALADGKTREEAYVEAGYSGHNCRANAHKFYRQNADYIKVYMSEHIGVHVPTAFKVVLEIATNPQEKAGIRLKAAQDIMDRGGYHAKQTIELVTRDATEMNTEELENEIRRLVRENPTVAALLNREESSGQ